jgi:hypothetical protein
MTHENDPARPRWISRNRTGITLFILAKSAFLARGKWPTGKDRIRKRRGENRMRIPSRTICPRNGMLAVILLALTATPGARSADKEVQIRVGTNVQVSESRKDTAHYEVVIAADPREGKNLVLASMASSSLTDINLYEVATFTSSDGGNTWKLARVQKGQAENESYFDPHLAYGADGSVYMVTMRNNPRKANAGNTELARSRDNGKTWDRTTLLPLNDRPFLVTDGSSGERDGLIACFAAGTEPLVAISRDGGKSFSAWKPLVKGGSPCMGNGVRLSNGTLVVAYSLRLGGKYPVPVTLTVARSTDGGQSYREAPTVAESLYSDSGLPGLATDPASSAYKDRLYLVWPDHTRVGQRVWLARSQDRAESWSKPILLSEQSGEGEAAKRYDSFLPAVAVNKTGVVGVMWHDSRDLPAKRRAWNIRFRASLDGGETWLPSVRVTDRESLFKEGVKLSSTLPGDTAGLVADANGVFHAAWVDNRTGVRQIWTAAIRVESGPTDD